MKFYKININQHLCDGCNICYVSCPINTSLKKKNMLNEKTAVIIVRNGKASQGVEGCDGCGVCVENCPLKAITITPI